jgi:hypothetical protein
MRDTDRTTRVDTRRQLGKLLGMTVRPTTRLSMSLDVIAWKGNATRMQCNK